MKYASCFRMVEAVHPDKAIMLYKKACEVGEVGIY